MGTLVVTTQPTGEYEDLPGQAAASELASTGFRDFTGVRIGRRFVLTVEGPVTEAHIAAARRAAETVLIDRDKEEIVRITSTDSGQVVAPWDDFGEVWGGDEGVAEATHTPRPGAPGHNIDERALGSVESGSIAWYDEAEEN